MSRYEKFMGQYATLKLAQCARCNKVFTKVKSAVCPNCQKDEDADFQKIRDILDYEPSLNAEQVAEKASIPVECVFRMLDAGLITSEGVGNQVKCGRCGAPAISAAKRLCQACLVKLDAEFTRAVADARLRKRLMDEAAAEEVHQMLLKKRKNAGQKRK